MIPPCLTLSNIRYISRVKWSNPGKGVVPSPTPQCSSCWKGSLLVAIDYGCQLLLTMVWFVLQDKFTFLELQRPFMITNPFPLTSAMIFFLLLYPTWKETGCNITCILSVFFFLNTQNLKSKAFITISQLDI